MKYSGKIGFWEDDVEIRPGVSGPKIVERTYTGDFTRNIQKWDSNGRQNDDINLNNRIGIIADLYLQNHLSSIKYLTYMGTKWKVKTMEIEYPRVFLEIGGVWNGVDVRKET